MRDARFVQVDRTLAGPVTLRLDPGEHLAQTFPSASAAAVVALLAAGIARATSGRVFVGEFDPRIQPVQVKRLVGYVPHEAVPHEFSSLRAYIEYRAALWGLPAEFALARARVLLEQLDGIHEAFAYPLAGALLARPQLLVLDRPQAAYAPQIIAVAGDAAIFSTHVAPDQARHFADGCARETLAL